ncbi:MAG: amino acid permease [Hyphomicrobiales bacterium]|nr:amino acid permease [Hyphomicrobiales bacterium]
MADPATAPLRASLSTTDAAAMLVGIVIGIGIFKTPSLVANFVPDETFFIGVWLLGGFVTFVGALCYAELGSARPSAGGEYQFLKEAYGPSVSVLFAWARCSVIQPGAIAAVAFVLGDYANVLINLGPYGAAIYAALGVLLITGVNFAGTLQGKQTQLVLSLLTVAAVLVVAVAGFMAPESARAPAEGRELAWGAVGLSMVFVLLTYGGWNEAAYLSGELKDVKRNMARALMLGVVVIVTLYMLINFAYLHVLGLDGLRKSNAVGADLMKIVAGQNGAIVLSLIVCITALSTLNGTIFTGARSYYALGRDVTVFHRLGIWEERGQTPANGLIVQGIIAVVLILFGSTTRDGFEAMVAYTAPVFWLFMLLVALSIVVFRLREPARELPFRVPLYPLPPLILAAACAWMFYSALLYAGWGSIMGVVVLAIGLPLILLRRDG